MRTQGSKQEEAMGTSLESSLTPSLGDEAAYSYIKVSDKEDILTRLRRIEGQVRGVQRMVEEEAYCVYILTQLSSIVSASQKVALLLVRNHAEHRICAAIEGSADAEEMVGEVTTAVERFLRV
jgi:DNA-binding FrmR family transcriptional regulator